MTDGPFSSFDVSGSALGAERLRMTVIAGNLANANTTRTPEGGPYRRLQVVFEPILQRAFDGAAAVTKGVKVARVEADRVSPFEKKHEPGNPDADANGDVLMPNVSPMLEMVDLLVAARAYEANLLALRTHREMLQKTIHMGRG